MVKVEEMELFSSKIISLVEIDNIGYIDAVIEYCTSIGLEEDIAASLISPVIKSKIAEEAMGLNLIEKTPMLPT